MPRRYIVAYDFLIFSGICVTFCELPLWEICIPRIVQAGEILIGCFVECQSIKKVGGRRSLEELYLNVSPSEKKIEPNRRLIFKCHFVHISVTSVGCVEIKRIKQKMLYILINKTNMDCSRYFE